MAYTSTIREEVVKNRLRKDYFHDYDATPILGNIDFAVAVPTDGRQLFETEYLLWAEAKKGTHADIRESFVQLILTIGHARTFDRHLPPAFLGAFDAEKIAFLPYYKVLDVFSQNDFNWNVTPSDHTTREFQQLMQIVEKTLNDETVLFHYAADDSELRRFIRQNFIVGKSRLSKIRISKNNFTAVYQKWRREVMPSINIDWDVAKRAGIIDADFYLADILSKDNATLKDKLYVLLRNDHYVLDRRINYTGLKQYTIAEFHDEQKAHHLFWNRYNRPPRREYWDYIVDRRDLLVPQDVRERKGSYFTPQRWVELSQQYIADEPGEDWQDEYTVWDCCAGTGNLLVGLTNKYNIWASTLDQADVDVMHDRIANGANLLDSHVFQFDFLNDPFSKLPQPLQDIINDPERRKKLVFYINPPYAEHGNRKQPSGTGHNKNSVATQTLIYAQYHEQMGTAARELYAQFFIRINKFIASCIVANFSTLKMLQAFNFRKFRNLCCPKLLNLFLVPSYTFDNVEGNFPIGFHIWNTEIQERFKGIDANVYDTDGKPLHPKRIHSYDECMLVIEWIRKFYDKESPVIGYLRLKNTDIQNKGQIFITSMPSEADFREKTFTYITANNLIPMCVYVVIRQVIEGTWLNDRDQFLYPNDGWQTDYEFQSDCLVYTLFNNNIQSGQGVNHWIPFTEAEVNAKEKFKSHFMTDYMERGHSCPRTDSTQPDLFAGATTLLSLQPHTEASPAPTNAHGEDKSVLAPTSAPRDHFSEEAEQVMQAGRELWRYYHEQPQANPDASFYDIRLHFQGVKTTKSGKRQMNADSTDERYTELIHTLRQRLKALAQKIEPKVYQYGFLKR